MHAAALEAHPLAGVAALTAVLALAMWHDLRERRIPNGLIVAGIAAVAALGAASPAAVLAGAFVGLMALLPFYAVGAAGAGDVKLLAVVGAFTGPLDALGILLMTLIAGGMLAAASASVAGVLPALARQVRSGGVAPDSIRNMRIPYSLAVAIGTASWLAIH